MFGEMALKGYIYRGRKPVHWSPSTRTALAEAELEVEIYFYGLSYCCKIYAFPFLVPPTKKKKKKQRGKNMITKRIKEIS